MTYYRDYFEDLRNEVEGGDVLYSEGFIFEFGCHLTPGGISRRARLERAEREDGLATGGNEQRSMNARSIVPWSGVGRGE